MIQLAHQTRTLARSDGEAPQCRGCELPLRHKMIDLGVSPLANAFLKETELRRMEPFYPLCVYVCEECFLVQLEAMVRPEEIFSEYPYFSSYSQTWLQHARAYTDTVIERFGLRGGHRIVEIASNDGYLLQLFLERGFDVLGVEPAANVARVALQKGIPTLVKFFGKAVARQMLQSDVAADLLIANNVLAHVPDLNDFVSGLKVLLRPGRGVITLEFPHLLRLMVENQFDTIYHEHLSYFSLIAVEKVFAKHRLSIFDVEELPTHGGSLRIYARHQEAEFPEVSGNVGRVLEKERRAGLNRLETYRDFDERVKRTKRDLLRFLIQAKVEGKQIVGYGAAAKGNTLLNYCGIRDDFIDYVVDCSPHKQGRFLPGTRIRVCQPERVCETRPDYLLILPWNLKDEIMEQMRCIRDWGGRFVVPIPNVQVL